MIFTNFALIFAQIVPKKFVESKVKNWLKYAGSKDNENIWMGMRLFLSTLVGMIFLLVPLSVIPLVNFILKTEIYFEFPINFLIAIGLFFLGGGGTFAIFYLHISYVIDGRRKMVENILPDFLYLVVNNLKSGMTPFYAFRSAVRPEFGPLSEEIQIATQKSLGVGSFSDALKDIAERIDSKVLADTTKFFAQALRSGGKLAQLIETSANDIKQNNELKTQLVSSTRMYALFIIFVVLIASPMLLAISVQFLQILMGIQSETAGMSGASQEQIGSQIGFSSGEITITPDFMKLAAMVIIIANAVLASIFLGIITGGKLKDGLKYAPILAVIGVIVFLVLVQTVGLLIGGFA